MLTTNRERKKYVCIVSISDIHNREYKDHTSATAHIGELARSAVGTTVAMNVLIVGY